MATNYPIITDTNITWSKEALEAINAIKETPFMITDISITMDAAKDADNEFIWSADCGLTPEEFFESDLFVNSPQRQREVIEYVLNKWILWKD